MQQQDVARVLSDPLAQELMQSSIPARLAYVGPDGFPRAIPIGFHWNGAAAIDIVDGVPPEYLAASRKGVGPDQWDAFEAQARALYKQMARIKITPLWAKLLDFKTRFPTPIEKLLRRAG